MKFDILKLKAKAEGKYVVLCRNVINSNLIGQRFKNNNIVIGVFSSGAALQI